MNHSMLIQTTGGYNNNQTTPGLYCALYSNASEEYYPLEKYPVEHDYNYDISEKVEPNFGI